MLDISYWEWHGDEVIRLSMEHNDNDHFRCFLDYFGLVWLERLEVIAVGHAKSALIFMAI